MTDTTTEYEARVTQQLADRFGAHTGFEVVAPFVARLAILLLGENFTLGQRGRTLIDDDVRREINDLFELARRHVEQDADARRHAFEIPNMADRRRKFDVAHALAP